MTTTALILAFFNARNSTLLSLYLLLLLSRFIIYFSYVLFPRPASATFLLASESPQRPRDRGEARVQAHQPVDTSAWRDSCVVVACYLIGLSYVWRALDPVANLAAVLVLLASRWNGLYFLSAIVVSEYQRGETCESVAETRERKNVP